MWTENRWQVRSDRITADGFHGREEDEDETRRVDISGSACTRANSRDLWRTDAPLNIDFSIFPILDIPANIADRWWHSIAPNLSRLSYTSTDFFKLIPLRRERSSESFGEIRYRLSSFLSNARFFSFFRRLDFSKKQSRLKSVNARKMYRER